MKTSTILLTTTICVLATATSLPSSETLATSDIWIGLNLNKCLVNAEVIPQAKWVPATKYNVDCGNRISPDTSWQLQTVSKLRKLLPKRSSMHTTSRISKRFSHTELRTASNKSYPLLLTAHLRVTTSTAHTLKLLSLCTSISQYESFSPRDAIGRLTHLITGHSLPRDAWPQGAHLYHTCTQYSVDADRSVWEWICTYPNLYRGWYAS